MRGSAKAKRPLARPFLLPLMMSRAIALLCCVISCVTSVTHAAIPGIVAELMQNYRRVVVLAEAAPPHLQGEARRAGHYLFVRNQHLQADLLREVRASGASGAGGTDVALRYREFAREVALNAKLEGDQLAFHAAFQILLEARVLAMADADDARRRLQSIGDVRRRFGADVPDASVPVKSGAARTPRPLWDAYVRTISAETPIGRVLDRLDAQLFGAVPPGEDVSEAAARARFLEWEGTELPPRTVLLTFDDGPHATHTPRVLDILKAHNVHAIFYMVGRNLGIVHNGVAVPGGNAAIVRRMVEEGHAVGNHTYSHPLLTRLDNEQLKREIENTQLLIDTMAFAATGNTPRTRTLRPPYGARNDRVLAFMDSERLRSAMWNIDSMDWADPVPESITRRVLREVEREGRGIILMHDIQARAVDALPAIISRLKQQGYTFLHWDGAHLAPQAESLPSPEKTP